MAINPDRYQTHIDRPNSNMLVGYLSDPSIYQAKDVAPVIQTPHRSDLFFCLPSSQWKKTTAQKRAPSTEAPKINYSVGTKRFDCDVFTVGIDLDDITTADQDAPLDAEEGAVELLASDMRICREKECVKSLLASNFWQGWGAPNDNAGVFRDYDPSDTYGFGQWDQPNANPAKDIAQLAKRIGRRGFRPNFIWMSRSVADALKNNPAIYGRFSGVVPQFLEDSQLAQILGIPNIMISDVTYNDAQERLADNDAYLLENEFLIGYKEARPNKYKPSYAYTFEWTGLPGSGGLEATVKTFRDEKIASTTMESWAAYTFQPVCLDLAAKGVNVLKNP